MRARLVCSHAEMQTWHRSCICSFNAEISSHWSRRREKKGSARRMTSEPISFFASGNFYEQSCVATHVSTGTRKIPKDGRQSSPSRQRGSDLCWHRGDVVTFKVSDARETSCASQTVEGATSPWRQYLDNNHMMAQQSEISVDHIRVESEHVLLIHEYLTVAIGVSLVSSQ